MATASVPAPTTEPAGRDPATIQSPVAYARGDAVWIYRAGAWRPGVVRDSTVRAALVEYRYAGSVARGTDSAIAADLAARDELDPYLDSGPTPGDDRQTGR